MIAAKAQDRPAPLTLVNTFHMGGAIADVGEEDTAFAERSAPYMVSIDGMWTDAADDEANIAWVRSPGTPSRSSGPAGSTSTSPAWPTRPASAGVDSALGRNLRGWPRSRRSTTRTTSSG